MTVLRAPFKAGPAARTCGPVFVSVTDFEVHRMSDVPAVIAAGARLRRAWPGRAGAVGMWSWIELPGRRPGSISVWEREADLYRFLRSPEHVEIVRRFRTRMAGSSSGWHAERFGAAEVWRRAAVQAP